MSGRIPQLDPFELATSKIANGIANYDEAELHSAGFEVFALQVGIKKEEMDEASRNFQEGVVHALSNVLEKGKSIAPDKITLDQLKVPETSEIFATIAAGDVYVCGSDMTDEAVRYSRTYVRKLSDSGLIEPIVSEIEGLSAWGLTDYGKQTFLGLLDSVLSKTVEEELLMRGVRNVLKKDSPVTSV